MFQKTMDWTVLPGYIRREAKYWYFDQDFGELCKAAGGKLIMLSMKVNVDVKDQHVVSSVFGFECHFYPLVLNGGIVCWQWVT